MIFRNFTLMSEILKLLRSLSILFILLFRRYVNEYIQHKSSSVLAWAFLARIEERLNNKVSALEAYKIVCQAFVSQNSLAHNDRLNAYYGNTFC